MGPRGLEYREGPGVFSLDAGERPGVLLEERRSPPKNALGSDPQDLRLFHHAENVIDHVVVHVQSGPSKRLGNGTNRRKVALSFGHHEKAERPDNRNVQPLPAAARRPVFARRTIGEASTIQCLLIAPARRL